MINKIQRFSTCLRLIPISIFLLSFTMLSAQAWQQLNDAPFVKHHTNGFGFDGKAYLMEGTNSENVSNEVWAYTADSDSWARIADFPGPGRSFSIGDDWNGKYYYGFGDGTSLLNDLWEFDPTTETFTELPSCPCTGRYHPAFIAHNDKIFMGTGSGPGGNMQDWWEYDMITQEWSQKPDVPGGARHHPFQFAIDDFIYVGGGHRSNWHQYNPETEEWLTIDNAPGGRVAGTQFSHDGYGYVLAGDQADHSHLFQDETFMRYNQDDDLWETLPSLPNGSRWAPSSFIIDDEVYFFSGIDYDGTDASVWKLNLKYLDCLPASNLDQFNLTTNSVDLFWESAEIMDSLKWRKSGDTNWEFVLDPESVYNLTGLDNCQEYEYVLVASCDDFGANSEIGTFTTDGCCENPAMTATTNFDNEATFEWEDVTGIDTYEIRWKAIDATDWDADVTTDTNYSISGLEECTKYEVQIKSTCGSVQMNFSESTLFLSKGCGACTDLAFCPVSDFSTSPNDFINEVRIGDFTNTTGSDGGYGNFIIEDPEVFDIGGSFELVIEPTFSGNPLNIGVWIDYNLDGEFSGAVERLLLSNSLNSTLTRTIDIPDFAEEGISRIRIIYGSAWPIDPCSGSGNMFQGEVEDYCIQLKKTSSVDGLGLDENISVYPNPFHNTIQLKGDFDLGTKRNVRILNTTGEILRSMDQWDLSKEIDMSKIPAGIYFIQIENELTSSKLLKVIKQ